MLVSSGRNSRAAIQKGVPELPEEAFVGNVAPFKCGMAFLGSSLFFGSGVKLGH